jgi:hypothetical protein
MEPESIDRIVAKHIRWAKTNLADHVILRHEQVLPKFGLVEIGKPNWSFEHRVSFVLSPMGYLTMTGDHDTVCWGHYSGKTVEGAIHWMARAHPTDHYFMEKASIGMGGRCALTEFNARVAFHDAIEYRKDAKKRSWDEDDPEDGRRESERWAGILRMLADGVEHLEEPNFDGDTLMQKLARIDEDFEIIESFGRAPTVRLIWSWLLVKKASDLLRAEAEPMPGVRLRSLHMQTRCGVKTCGRYRRKSPEDLHEFVGCDMMSDPVGDADAEDYKCHCVPYNIELDWTDDWEGPQIEDRPGVWRAEHRVPLRCEKCLAAERTSKEVK